MFSADHPKIHSASPGLQDFLPVKYVKLINIFKSKKGESKKWKDTDAYQEFEGSKRHMDDS